MQGNITLAIVKPGAFRMNYTVPILSRIHQEGFRISAIRSLKMSRKLAEQLYEIHKGKDFFEKLVDSMISGPVVAVLLEKDNAVEDFRKLIGKTNPAEAEENTLRRLYGTSVRENAVHGSDSDENAIREAALFFSQDERF